MNALTGDFAAVLEVGASTLSRLLASMHQVPPASGPGVPGLPHNGWLRVGDQETIDGVRGTGRAQVSVPQVELIDRSEDRVAFRIWLRIWYLADPGTAPMPEFSHGVLRAEYGLQIKHVPQSPQTPRGGAYGLLGVIPGTVSFHSVGGAGSTDAEIAK
ncbi:MAG: hypothetical protein JOY58_13945, partial [Solirubrobacterales bacterium]|nr:hypothetical protein [Solirubrobacterales bacterium]